jgi:AraC family transcriptional regulator
VHLEYVKPLMVAFVRHTGIYDGAVGPETPLAAYWEDLFRWGKTTGLAGPDSLLIGIAQDDPTVTRPDKARFDICVQVAEFRAPTGTIGCQTIGPGLYGVARHYGPFDHIAETYSFLYDSYVARRKYELRLAPPFEVYNHTQVRADLQIHYTDVYLPLQAKMRESLGVSEFK